MNPFFRLAVFVCLLGGLTWGSGERLRAQPTAVAPDLKASALGFREQLSRKVLPYWFDTAQDRERGGYRLADDGHGPGRALDKQLVSQSRMVWGFSHAWLKGYRDPQRDYLAAATQGYRFLTNHFLDPVHGGYYWKVDLAGQPLVDCKFLYGESFVVYALVEYYRASGDRTALDQALKLYRTIQSAMHDSVNGGWLEHTTANGQPLPPGDPRNEVEVVGLKSANAHLHWMEALAELYQATGDAEVRKSLEEALALNQRYFYPLDAGKSCFHRQPDWKEATGPGSRGLSYGHNVEFAWLMVRAEQVLGREPSWSHFYRHLDHALAHGWDAERGGLYHRGVGDQPAADRDKIWWVQAEMLAALTDALAHRDDPRYRAALAGLLGFLERHQIDPKDGLWFDTVTEDGKPKNPAKAHNWKANYHDVRGMVKFVDAFGR